MHQEQHRPAGSPWTRRADALAIHCQGDLLAVAGLRPRWYSWLHSASAACAGVALASRRGRQRWRRPRRGAAASGERPTCGHWLFLPKFATSAAGVAEHNLAPWRTCVPRREHSRRMVQARHGWGYAAWVTQACLHHALEFGPCALSSAASFFRVALISLLTARNSASVFLRVRWSAPSSAAI